MTYEELVERTAAVFDGELELPISKEQEKAIGNIYDFEWRAQKIYGYRLWQARALGFKNFTVPNLVKTLYGDQSLEFKLDFNAEAGKERFSLEYVFNHHQNKEINEVRWHTGIETYTRYKRKGLLYWPPFKKNLMWSCRLCPLNSLSKEIPPEVMLKILRVQKLKLFNAFQAIEPIKPKGPTIYLGVIWEMPPIEKPLKTKYTNAKASKLVYEKAGKQSFVFLSNGK